MDFGRRGLTSIERFERLYFLFDLASAPRVFLAELIADPIYLEAFELTFVAEFITRTVAQILDVPA